MHWADPKEWNIHGHIALQWHTLYYLCQALLLYNSFQEGDQPKVVADSGKVLCDVDVGEREGRVGSVSPLNSYTNLDGDLSCYSDWVIQRANEIYPILGISFKGHKLQLLDFLSFLEVDRLLGEGGALSCGGKKGKREVKNLECSINYDARGSCSNRGKRKTRGHPVVL
jgi:hypothetical protein